MEQITTLNQRLIDHFGIDSNSGKPIFRIVWANDEVEKRKMSTLDNGILLLFPVVREVKKYPYIRDFYVLERLVVVPDFQREELADVLLSYEPVWVFKDSNDNPLPPAWDPCKLIVDTLYAALGKNGGLRKYVDPDVSPEVKEERITKLQEELFGDQSGLYGKTTPGAHEGIVVPPTYESSK
jgi:hypothetical protein